MTCFIKLNKDERVSNNMNVEGLCLPVNVLSDVNEGHAHYSAASVCSDRTDVVGLTFV